MLEFLNPLKFLWKNNPLGVPIDYREGVFVYHAGATLVMRYADQGRDLKLSKMDDMCVRYGDDLLPLLSLHVGVFSIFSLFLVNMVFGNS